jgi:cytochrome P450
MAKQSTAPAKTPPGPPGYLFFTEQEAMRNQLPLYTSVFERYGDFVKLDGLPGISWYLVARPSAIEHILVTHQNRYRKPDVFNKTLRLLVGNGLIVNEGDSWLSQRRLMQPAFHKERLANLAKSMIDSTKQLIEQWQQLDDDSEIDIAAEMSNLTLTIAGKTLFGLDLSDKAEMFGASLRQALSHVSKKMNNPFTFPEWLPTEENKQFKNARNNLFQVVDEIIAHRRKAAGDRGDLLSMLMAAQDEASGAQMSDAQLRDEVITLLVAGHDTVAATLAWVYFLLGSNTAAQTRLQAELQSELQTELQGAQQEEREAQAAPEHCGQVSLADLPKLTYTRAVIDEALRLYPPAWGQPREAIEDDQIDGYFVPKGRIIAVSQYLAQRHPDHWNQPLEFHPERFLAGDSLAKERPKFSYFPFGGGSRMCIGNNFAMMEAQIVVALISQSFTIALVGNQDIKPDPTFTLRPDRPVQVKLQKRK